MFDSRFLAGACVGAAAVLALASALALTPGPTFRLIGTGPDGSAEVLDSGLTADDCGDALALGAALRTPYALACQR